MVVVFDFRLPKFATLLVSVKTNKLKSYIFTSWIKDMNINSLFSQLKRFIYTSNLKRVFFLHMSCKICCPRGCIVTPIAFVWILSTVCCQMSPQIRIQSHINCIWLAFLHCVFSNGPSKRQKKKIYNHTDCICVTLWIFKLLASEDLKFHWLHSFNFSPLCVFKCVLKWLALEDA